MNTPIVDQPPALERKRLKIPETAPRPKPREASPAILAEKKRREQIKSIKDSTAELDREIISLLPTTSLEERIDVVERLEALRDGAESERAQLGAQESGENATYRAKFEGITAYVKPQSGDNSFRYDADKKSTFEVRKKWNGTTRVFDTVETPVHNGSLKAYCKQQYEQMPQNRELIAKYYGITPEEVPLNKNEIGMRTGVDSQSTAVREMIPSRFDLLTGFDVIPLTTLRAEKLNTDYSSVQEAVPGKGMTYKLFEELKDKGSHHPGAKSFMRIACLDYLFKALDRHAGNILYDAQSEHFSAIDNGLSSGLSRALTEQEKTKGVKRPVHMDPGGLDQMRSIPLEIIQKHDDWSLDEEARGRLQALYDATVAYLKKRELRDTSATHKTESSSTEIDEAIQEGTTAQSMDHDEKGEPTDGREIKYVTKLFRLLYGNENIAKREALEFFGRIKYLIDHGRPPHLALGTALFPFENYLKRQAEEDARGQAA